MQIMALETAASNKDILKVMNVGNQALKQTAKAMYVCVCVRVYVCVCMCVCLCLCVCVFACSYV